MKDYQQLKIQIMKRDFIQHNNKNKNEVLSKDEVDNVLRRI